MTDGKSKVLHLTLKKKRFDEILCGEKKESLSFDHLVTYYDETRDFDEISFQKALHAIISIVPTDRYSKIFEPGIGNGRIAIPMNKLGYKITGIDISQNMLNELNQRIIKEGIIGLNYQIGDVSCIPFNDLSFDAAIATHLFYFVSEWEKACDEIARVTKGPIILLHTGMGQEISVLNDKYKALCQKYGVKFPQTGVSSTKEVVDHFKQKGYRILFEDKWTWKKKVDAETAIDYLEKRAYSFTSWANDEIHNKVISKLRKEKIEISEVEDRISLIILDREV